jgi:hypothetical protein
MKGMKTPLAKALEINLDPSIYGAFAEIGAGQEVARQFFQAGQASATIAKTISAYDMVYSDEIYGKEASGRYVCESRLQKMLTKEYDLLTRRLEKTRGDKTRFFAYANTVTTGDQSKRTCHGWMGVRFQSSPGEPTNDLIVHVRMLDRFRLQQQETLGILGANLVHACFFSTKNPKEFLPALTENIKSGQVAIDLIRCSGPVFKNFNNHLLNLSLVRRGLAEATLFAPNGEIVLASDELYGQPLLIERGEFKPISQNHLDLIKFGKDHFKQDFKKTPQPIFEMTMGQLIDEGHIDETDFLDRVETLLSLKTHVLVSNFFLYYRLKRFLRSFTSSPIALLMKADHLTPLFDETHYKDLEGGILEGLGKLLDTETRVYAFPIKKDKQCLGSDDYRPKNHLGSLFDLFKASGQICDLGGCSTLPDYFPSESLRKMIRQKNSGWEKFVPTPSVAVIKAKNLFGYSGR